MALIDGDEFVSGDILSFQQGNRIKDHWRAAAAVANPQPGMPFSDSDEEQYYLRWAASWRLNLQEWDNTFIINPSGGGHYKTIQAALTAENAGGETFLVPPGTYTDTIHFSAVNQSVIALGDFNNTEVTQVDANIVDAGAHTGCSVHGIKINLSAPTTAIYNVQASTGSVDIVDCHLHLATAVALVAANQPALVNISGAGEIQIIRGLVEFFHTGNTGGGGIKCAFKVSANGALLHLHSINKGTITNSGTSLSSCIYTDFGTAVVEMHFCHDFTVTDPNCTILVGLGYIGAAGAHNIMSNHIDVVATNNAGWGLYHVGTGTIRMSHNTIHVTDAAGTSNSYYIGAAATLETHMDEWRADDGSTIIAGGTLHIVSSEDEGELTISSSLDMLDDARITGGNDDTILEMYDESQNDAIVWGLPVAAARGLIFCDVADIAVDFTGLITAHPQPVAWFIDLDNDSYLGIGHQINDRPGIWSGAADTSILALQYDANADITVFESSGAGENREERIYGYITAGTAPRYGAFRIDDTNDEFLVEAENNANHEGITINLLETNQRFRIRQNGDYISWRLDGLSVLINWSDGSLTFQTDETDASTAFVLLPNGTSETTEIDLYDATDRRLRIFTGADRAQILSEGGSLGINRDAANDVLFYEQAASGETPEVKIYGFRAADALRSLEIGVGVDAANTASFDGLGSYYFDGNIGIGTFTFGTNAVDILAMFNATAPTTSPADTFQQWSADVLSVAGKAGPHYRSEEGGMLAWHGGAGTINNFTYQADIADDGSFTLPAITDSAWGMCQAGNNEEYAMFSIDDDGDVTLHFNSANVVANADTDGNLCIGIASPEEPLTIRNRLGAQKNINLIIWYS